MTVTIPDEGDLLSVEIPVERIRAYEVAAVPAPANLMQGQPVPTRYVAEVKVKVGDEWIAL